MDTWADNFGQPFAHGWEGIEKSWTHSAVKSRKIRKEGKKERNEGGGMGVGGRTKEARTSYCPVPAFPSCMHSSGFYHAINEGLVDPKRVVQIGIRSPVQRDTMQWTVCMSVGDLR